MLNQKIRSAITASGALAVLLSTPAQALDDIPRDTLLWHLDNDFTRMAQRCLNDRFDRGKFRKQRIQGLNVRTTIPPEILDWDNFDENAIQPIAVNQTQGIAPEFVKIFQHNGDKYVEVPRALPVTWSATVPPILGSHDDNLFLNQNCITLVNGTAKAGVDIKFLQAAVDASMTSERASISNTYAGRIFSPYAWALNPNNYPSVPVDTDKRPEYLQSRNLYLFNLWNWYKDNHALIGEDLHIRANVIGYVRFKNDGLTQQKLLNAEASGGFSLGFLSVGGGADLEIRRQQRSNSSNFMSFTLPSNPGYDRLTPIDDLATEISDAIRVRAPTSKPSIDANGSLFDYTVTLDGVPRAFCASHWKGKVGAGFKLEDFETFWHATEEQSACQARFRLRPGQYNKDGSRLNLSLTNTIAYSSNGATNAVTIDLSPAVVDLVDKRGDISFGAPGTASLLLPAAASLESRSIKLEYPVIELNGSALGTLNPNASKATISCAGEDAQEIAKEMTSVGDLGRRSVVVDLDIPASAFISIAPGTLAACDINVSFYAQPGVTYGSPQTRISVAREAPPAPEPVVEQHAVETEIPTPEAPENVVETDEDIPAPEEGSDPEG